MINTQDFPPDLVVDLAQLAQPETVKAFERSGCLKIRNYLPEQKIVTLASSFSSAPKPRQQKIVGDRRIMTPVSVEGVFHDQTIYAQGPLSAFCERTLGKAYVISCFTCVTSSPGAPAQHRHRDYWPLFSHQIDFFAPSFAINLFIPLVRLDKTSGTTRMWPGSHRNPGLDPDGTDQGGIHPELSPGDALLMDYSVVHEGTPNLAQHDRPILTIGFAREWFLDSRNFDGVNPLTVPQDTFDAMDTSQRARFSRSRLYRNVRA